MLHHYAKKFFAPLLVSPFLTSDNQAYVSIVSELLHDMNNLQLEITLYDLKTSAVVKQEVIQVDAVSYLFFI
jgi:hypothetical protein